MSSPVLHPVYTGSVKTVYQASTAPSISYFAFTDDYSVFDWGKMPDSIPHKGRVLSLMGGWFFQQIAQPHLWQSLPQSLAGFHFNPDVLERLFSCETFQQLRQNGLSHHFLGWTNQNGQEITLEELYTQPTLTPLLKVQTVEVNRPQKFNIYSRTLFDYPKPDHDRPFLIPLEVVFRFGMPEGSSMQKRLEGNPNYYRELGLNKPPVENIWFERPVIEFFTKLEPTDRYLFPQEAFLISGLTPAQFETLYNTTLLLAFWLFSQFSNHHIELWDGKFEFAFHPQHGLMLVDSIGPDELRLKHEGVHLSKEVIRQFYRGSSWEKSLSEAKKLAASLPSTNWKDLCQNQLQQSPTPLTDSQLTLVWNLYGTLLNKLLNQTAVKTTMSFEEVITELQQQQQPMRVTSHA